MTVEHHPLIKDFPELRDRIHALKGQAHFAKLEKEYEDLDKQIVRAETRVENLSDDQVETLKQQRVRLKDELYKLLTA
ncbi:YdcH family protein [Aquabacterium sp.]|uniref:YdcH family protein n=1 Tax=Aquabacterium sp. TaxID=1872578 RepID=UPI0035B4B49F